MAIFVEADHAEILRLAGRVLLDGQDAIFAPRHLETLVPLRIYPGRVSLWSPALFDQVFEPGSFVSWRFHAHLAKFICGLSGVNEGVHQSIFLFLSPAGGHKVPNRMGSIPLEDNFNDIVGKAQRGLKLSDADLASRAGMDADAIARIKGGEVDEAVLRRIAPVLNLAAEALVQSAKKGWHPPALQVNGLAQFNTPYEDMTVNSYLAWDTKSKEAVAFDTGADSGPILRLLKERGLTVKLILLTHTHPDHIADLACLKKETGASAHVSALEATNGVEGFYAGKTFH